MEQTESRDPIEPARNALPCWRKLAYAIGEFARSVGPGTVVPFRYLFFLTDVARMNPAIAGVTLLSGGIWDAAMRWSGRLLDRTRTGWGRRRPCRLFGVIPCGIAVALLCIVPLIRNWLLLGMYIAVVYMLFGITLTFVDCPYSALAPELTLDRYERTVLTTHRMVVSIAAGLGLVAGFALLLGAFPGDRAAAWFHPADRDRHEAVQLKAARRRATYQGSSER